MDISKLTYTDAQKLLAEVAVRKQEFQSNLLFFAGDHWQRGTGWVGPILDSGHPLYKTTLQSVQAMFVSANKVKEVVSRERDAVVGRDPSWALLHVMQKEPEDELTDEQSAHVEVAEAIFREWFNNRNAMRELARAVESVLLTGRAVMRLYVPANKLDENRELTAYSLDDAARVVYLDVLSTFSSAVLEDRAGVGDLGVYIYTTDGPEGDVRRVEVTYADEGATVLRVLDEDGADVGEPALFDMGGNLFMKECSRNPLITEQVRQLQRALNLTLTMLSRNVVQAGFLERYFFNAQLPVKEIRDEVTGNTIGYEPAPMTVGPGTSQFLAGVKTSDSSGNESVATPSALFHEPSPATTFVDSAAELYARLLEESGQIHVLISGDATASGKSRQEARAEFESAVMKSAGIVEEFMRWLIPSVLSLVADISGDPGFFSDIRTQVRASIAMGPLDGPEQAAVIGARDAGIISTATARARMGVADIVQEEKLVAHDRTDSADLLLKRAQIANVFVSSGASLYAAAIAAGLTAAQADALVLLPRVDEGAEY